MAEREGQGGRGGQGGQGGQGGRGGPGGPTEWGRRWGLWPLSRANAAWIALAGLLTTHIVLGVLLFDPKPFIGGDNAGYMILAESIETGQGYRDIYLPGAPPHGQYPPFYPAILAVALAAGGGLALLKGLSLVFTTASVIFLFLLARARMGPVAALAAALPFALSPLLLYYSHWVLSEAPFVLLTLVALWAAERLRDSAYWLAVALVAALLAYLTRAAGLPLLAALALSLGWHREWRKLGVLLAGAVPVMGGWWFWGKLVAARSAQTYGSNFLLVDPYTPELGYIGPGDLFVRTANNLRLYSFDVLPDALAGGEAGGALRLLAVLASLLVIALALVAWSRDVRQVRTLESFTLFYAGLMLIWPQVWTDQRFLLPLIPVILLYAVAGASWCFEFIRTTRPVWFLPLVGALLAVLTLPDHVRAVSVNRRCLRLERQGIELACHPPAWRSFFELAGWVKSNTPEDAIIVTRKPRLFYVFSRRHGDVYPFTSDDSKMLTFLDDLGANYVVVAGLSQTTFRYLVPVVRDYRGRFELTHQIGDGAVGAYLLGYLGERVAGGGEQGQGERGERR